MQIKSVLVLQTSTVYSLLKSFTYPNPNPNPSQILICFAAQIRQMKNQSTYDRKGGKMLSHLIKQTFGPQCPPVVPVMSKNRFTIFRDQEDVTKC